MVDLLKNFSYWLASERGVSPNTAQAYQSDLTRYVEYLATAGKTDPATAETADIYSYLAFLSTCGLAPASIRRELSSIRSFHRFLVAEALAQEDPTTEVTAPKMWKRVPKALSVPEIETLLAQPDPKTRLGLRDKAMLEFTYGTGMRVSEVIGFELEGLNLKSATARCMGKRSRERVVPIGGIALKWIRIYLEEARPFLVKGADPGTVFLNWRGKSLTRMGFWKILSKYVTMAGIRSKVTPHVLRHSCATHLLDGGATLRDVQQILGHKDIATTQVYAKVDMEYLRDAILTFHPRGLEK